MKKRLLKIFSLLIILTLLISQADFVRGLFWPSTAYAVAGLVIDWGVTPGEAIFVIGNMAPGDVESRTVKVRNGSTDTLQVGIRGMKQIETGNLAEALDIIIRQNGTDLYGGTSSTGAKTLQEFFDDAPIPAFIALSSLAHNQDATYTIIVVFKQSAGNAYQNSNITFDLRIGPAIAVPVACQNIHFTNEPIYGTKGNDILKGTNGPDMIFGFRGNDIIDGKGGDDCIVGGSGNDAISSGNGDDVVLADEGNDIVKGERGNDILFAGKGNDILDGGIGVDSCTGGKIRTRCEVSP